MNKIFTFICILAFCSCNQETKKNSSAELPSQTSVPATQDDFQDLKKENKAGCNDKNTKEEIEKKILEMQKSNTAATLQGKKDTDCVVK